MSQSFILDRRGALYQLDRHGHLKRVLAIGEKEKAISVNISQSGIWICTDKHISLIGQATETRANRPIGAFPFFSRVPDFSSVTNFDTSDSSYILVQKENELYVGKLSGIEIDEKVYATGSYIYTAWAQGENIFLAGMNPREITNDYPKTWGTPVIMLVKPDSLEAVNLGDTHAQKYLRRNAPPSARNLVLQDALEAILDSMCTKDGTCLLVCPIIRENYDSYLCYKDLFLPFPLLDDYSRVALISYSSTLLDLVEYLDDCTYAGKLCRDGVFYCYFPASSLKVNGGIIDLTVLTVDGTSGERNLKKGKITGIDVAYPDSRANFFRFWYDNNVGYYGVVGYYIADGEECSILRSNDGIIWEAQIIKNN